MSDPTPPGEAATGPGRRRWWYLVVGLLGLIAACAAQNGLPFLTLALRREGLSLPAISLLLAAPAAGMVLSLLGWGALADRFGERSVLASGLAIAGAALLVAAAADDPVPTGLALLVAGAGSASVHAASGRLVLGWFPARQRGLAMGIRQMGQPLGVGLAALLLPRVSGGGPGPAFALLAVGCLVSAVLIALLVRNPARPAADGPAGRGSSPYRGSSTLWRVHGASSLLVVPQMVVAGFAFDALTRSEGWSAAAAGTLLGISQAGGAAARVGVGVWSDRAGSRLGPLRRIAAAVAGAVALLAAVSALPGDALGPVIAGGAVALAAIATVSPNGVAFTSVAERAGSAWAGRALGTHNTLQNLVGAGTVPLAALVIDSGAGYAAAFAIGSVAALAAVGVVPGRDTERPAGGGPAGTTAEVDVAGRVGSP